MEWVGLLAVVALLLVALVAAGARLPGAGLARAVASKLLCAAALAERCGDEPVLISAYGSEVGRLAREHMPSLAFERGSRALPVDFRRCRDSACADGSARGLVHRTDAGLPVTAFVHVIDCREAESAAPADALDRGVGRSGPSMSPSGRGVSSSRTRASASAQAVLDPPDCSGERAGNLYIQYWLYYVDSATLRGVPVAGGAGYHRDDWESIQVRIAPDGEIDERASSHHGYNHDRGPANAGSDAGVGALRGLAETLGTRPRNGWGPRNGLLLVSGGSHAGNADGYLDLDRIVPAGRVRLVPLEPIAAAPATSAIRFAVSPPWRKRVWLDPETVTTD